MPISPQKDHYALYYCGLVLMFFPLYAICKHRPSSFLSPSAIVAQASSSVWSWALFRSPPSGYLHKNEVEVIYLRRGARLTPGGQRHQLTRGRSPENGVNNSLSRHRRSSRLGNDRQVNPGQVYNFAAFAKSAQCTQKNFFSLNRRRFS